MTEIGESSRGSFRPGAGPSEHAAVPIDSHGHQRTVALLVLAAGIALLVVPTFVTIARGSWASEQGAHGPIVLAIAIWLFARTVPAMRRDAIPGSGWLGGLVLGSALIAYVATRLVGSMVLESAAMYAALVATLYLLVGARAMRAAWFPIAYFAFVLPPPGSWVAAATQPLRLQISDWAVWLLSLIGYPAGRSGLLIYVGQYVLEVKAACGGLNSILSLTAIGLFYVYIRHNANWRYAAFMLLIIVAMAIIANYVRVLLLILITYHLGEAAGQGFLHDFAGMTMFLVAMLGIWTFDTAAGGIRKHLAMAA